MCYVNHECGDSVDNMESFVTRFSPALYRTG
jgi:hypothetical protein